MGREEAGAARQVLTGLETTAQTARSAEQAWGPLETPETPPEHRTELNFRPVRPADPAAVEMVPQSVAVQQVERPDSSVLEGEEAAAEMVATVAVLAIVLHLVQAVLGVPEELVRRD